MKKTLLLFSCFLLLLCSCARTVNQYGNIREGKLILSTNADFPPYQVRTDDGDYEGIDIEVSRLIAERLGLELVIDDMDFEAALFAVQQGRGDLIPGVSITEERRAVMDFSKSYASGVQVVIIIEGSGVNFSNLNEKIIGTERGSTAFLYVSNPPEMGGFGDDHVIAYDSVLSAIQALLNGQIDCVIFDDIPAQEIVKLTPGLEILKGKWMSEDYAFGLAKGNTKLLEAVNQTIDDLMNDGTIQGIIERYISVN